MTTSSKATNGSHCGLLYLRADLGASVAGSHRGFAKVTILNN